MTAALLLLVSLHRQAPASRHDSYESIPYKRLIPFKPGFNMATTRFWVDQLVERQTEPARGSVARLSDASSKAMADELYRTLDNDLVIELARNPESTPLSRSGKDQFSKAMIFWAMGSGRYWSLKDHARLSLAADSAFEECLQAREEPLSSLLRRFAEMARALNMRVFDCRKAEAGLEALAREWETEFPLQAFLANMHLAEVYWHTDRQSEAKLRYESARERFRSLPVRRSYDSRLGQGFWRDHFCAEATGIKREDLPAPLCSDGMTTNAISHHLEAFRDSGIPLVPFEPEGEQRLLQEIWDPTDVMPEHFEKIAQLAHHPDVAPYVIYDRRTRHFFPRESGFGELRLEDALAVLVAEDLKEYSATLNKLWSRRRPYWRFGPDRPDQRDIGDEFMAIAKLDRSGRLVKVHGQRFASSFLWGPWPKYVLDTRAGIAERRLALDRPKFASMK